MPQAVNIPMGRPVQAAPRSVAPATQGPATAAKAPSASLSRGVARDELKLSTGGNKTTLNAAFARDARAAADKIATVPDPQKSAPFMTVKRDLVDANARTAERDAAAAEQVVANQAPEAAQLAALTAPQRAAYDRVATAVAADPAARLDLQVLLAEGKLTGADTSKSGRDLLGELDRVATQPVAAGINRSELTADLVQEIAHPTCISQQTRGTCIVTSFQTKVAMEQPAEYARIVGGLASPAGKVQLAGGAIASRVADTAAPDDTDRTASSRLFQPAMENVGGSAEGESDYSNAEDMFLNAGHGGLTPRAADKVLANLTGQKVRSIDFDKETNPEVAAKQFDQLVAAANAGQAVPVGLSWGLYSRHQLLVTKIADGQVHVNNPHGKEETMPIAAFRQRLERGMILGR